MLRNALWRLLLSANGECRAQLKDIMEQLIQLVPLSLFLFGLNEDNVDRQKFCEGLCEQWKPELQTYCVKDYLECRDMVGLSLETCEQVLVLLGIKKPSTLPRSCYEKKGFRGPCQQGMDITHPFQIHCLTSHTHSY